MTGDDVAHIQRRGDRGKWWSKGQPRQILGAPQHDYPRALIAAAPALAKRRQPLARPDPTQPPIRQLQNVGKTFARPKVRAKTRPLWRWRTEPAGLPRADPGDCRRVRLRQKHRAAHRPRPGKPQPRVGVVRATGRHRVSTPFLNDLLPRQFQLRRNSVFGATPNALRNAWLKWEKSENPKSSAASDTLRTWPRSIASRLAFRRSFQISATGVFW